MTRPTLLIVDDEPINLSVLSQILSQQYMVRVANSGARALEVVSTQPIPDLILLDVMMPEMDGYEVLRRLKDNQLTVNIPVIFVTAMEALLDEKKGFELGAVDYVTKPIRAEILLERIKSQLILKQARDFLSDKNQFLEAEVDRRMKDYQLIQNVSIRALAHLAETRDTETGNHIIRTQAYVQILAQFLQNHPNFKKTLTDGFIDLITKSAPLHDIGKVGIPDSILLKPGKLNAEEWAIMQTHTALGVQAIEKSEIDVDREIDFLVLAKQIVHWHHERWDGTGYPDELVGEEIPVSARLMALADVFDALTTRRVYKPPYSPETAHDIIMQEKGKQFDPDIADAFDKCFDQFVYQAKKYGDGVSITPAA